jgi:hypothetical protein
MFHNGMGVIICSPEFFQEQHSWARHRELFPGELIALLAHPRRVINSSPAFFKHEGLNKDCSGVNGYRVKPRKNLRQTDTLSRGSRNTLSRFTSLKWGISTCTMNHINGSVELWSQPGTAPSICQWTSIPTWLVTKISMQCFVPMRVMRIQYVLW